MSGDRGSHYEIEDYLILTKTYPTPSTKYRETTCVAAFTRAGELRRLFPVPFRLLEGDQQFKRWEWVRMKSSRKSSDRRPESRKIEIDSIIRLDESMGTEHGWRDRLKLVDPHVLSDPGALEARRERSGETFGFVRPTRCRELEITAVADREWTHDELAKLSADGLFDSIDARARTQLRKLPFDFRYHYECDTPEGPKEFSHKVTDWEFGALFWRCFRRFGPKGWEEAFRQRAERDFFEAKQLYFLLGTIHAYPNRWLIVGVMYPPKPPAPSGDRQLDLLLGL